MWSRLGGPLDGGLREYIVLPSSTLVRVPAKTNLSYAQLAAIVCTGASAWNSLYGNIPLSPGQTVLFLGKFILKIMCLKESAGLTS
jgi:NADPH:quinone reductase-like Zn-dependent oxidoreductase